MNESPSLRKIFYRSDREANDKGYVRTTIINEGTPLRIQYTRFALWDSATTPRTTMSPKDGEDEIAECGIDDEVVFFIRSFPARSEAIKPGNRSTERPAISQFH